MDPARRPRWNANLIVTWSVSESPPPRSASLSCTNPRQPLRPPPRGRSPRDPAPRRRIVPKSSAWAGASKIGPPAVLIIESTRRRKRPPPARRIMVRLPRSIRLVTGQPPRGPRHGMLKVTAVPPPINRRAPRQTRPHPPPPRGRWSVRPLRAPPPPKRGRRRPRRAQVRRPRAPNREPTRRTRGLQRAAVDLCDLFYALSLTVQPPGMACPARTAGITDDLSGGHRKAR